MKHKTSELTGALLDAAVAKAEGWTKAEDDSTAWWAPDGHAESPCASITDQGIRDGYGYHPAHSWSHGGPIIESERIELHLSGGGWCARVGTCGTAVADDKSALIAAMRAYVASKLGDEVEL